MKLWRRSFLVTVIFVFLFTTKVLAAPSLQITSIPSSVNADEQFSISVTLAGLESNTDYRLKSLGRIDGNEKLKTLSHDETDWLAYNGDWDKMPKITSNSEGSASATIQSKFYDNASGQASAFFRTRKDSGGDNYDSSSVSVTVNPKPSPSPSPSPSPNYGSSTPTPSPSPTPKASVLGTTTSTKKPSPSPTLEPVEFLNKEKPSSVDVLGTETAAPSGSPEATGAGIIFTKGAILSWVLTISGVFFLIAAAIPFVRARLKSLSHDKPDTPS